jgi:hypothetical protein
MARQANPEVIRRLTRDKTNGSKGCFRHKSNLGMNLSVRWFFLSIKLALIPLAYISDPRLLILELLFRRSALGLAWH